MSPAVLGGEEVQTRVWEAQMNLQCLEKGGQCTSDSHKVCLRKQVLGPGRVRWGPCSQCVVL